MYEKKERNSADLSRFEVISYGLGGFAITLNSMFIASFGQFFMTDYMGMGAATAGTLMMLITLFDAVNDPFMGVVVDNTHSRWGKFKPWMTIGAIFGGVLMVQCEDRKHSRTSQLLIEVEPDDPKEK